MAKILDMLADGNWHIEEEVLEKTGLKQEQLEAIIKFLKDYGFVVEDAEKGLVKLNENFRRLLSQEANQQTKQSLHLRR
jgi:DNA-binding IclR family transcriptional regulator